MKDYKKDIEIDPFDIVEANLTQPSVYVEYTDLYADAIDARDRAKSHLDLVFAELEDIILRDWEKYYEKFPAEQIRSNWIIRQDRYKKALDSYQKASHDANRLQGARSAFEHRKKSIENHVNFCIYGLNAEPKFNRKMEVKRSGPAIIKRRIITKPKGQQNSG